MYDQQTTSLVYTRMLKSMSENPSYACTLVKDIPQTTPGFVWLFVASGRHTARRPKNLGTKTMVVNNMVDLAA